MRTVACNNILNASMAGEARLVSTWQPLTCMAMSYFFFIRDLL